MHKFELNVLVLFLCCRKEPVYPSSMETSNLEHSLRGHGNSCDRWKFNCNMDSAGAQKNENGDELFPM